MKQPSTSAVAPGVYVPAIASPGLGVPTAVPIFVGYTERAEIDGTSVRGKPVQVSSLADVERVFGGAPRPRYRIRFLDAPADDGFQVWNPTGATPGEVYFTLERVDGSYNLYNTLRLFYANGGADAYVVSVGTYGDSVRRDDLIGGLDAAAQQVGPTILCVPDAVLLPPDDPATPWVSADFAAVAAAMLVQASTLEDRIAVLDVYGTPSLASPPAAGATLDTVIQQFRMDVGDAGLDYGAAYFPFVLATVVSASEVDYGQIDDSPAEAGDVGLLQSILTWENQALNASDDAARAAVQADIDRIPTATDVSALNTALLAALPILSRMEQRVADDQNLLPPCGAMAGVMAKVDATEGVWVAPANVTLAAVARPTVALTNAQQEALNLPLDGKAVNALREFVGRGTVPWGARTLDGNSNDFRYVQVRRTLIYIEQSIKNMLNPFAFAPNTGQTWASVVSLVSSFLTGIWAEGGLMGATASEAFSVECGLGSTMTAQDVLNGLMIVQVTMQMTHVGEYIVYTHTQQMQGDG